MASVDHVEPYLYVYKFGSGDISCSDIIRYVAKKGKPGMHATGASDMGDVERLWTSFANMAVK
ncbi:MAG: hypothetical protein HOG34_04245 [Bacteroidetes bacterium]|nr:hypothetical protein [Bacteroidota bacterium]